MIRTLPWIALTVFAPAFVVCAADAPGDAVARDGGKPQPAATPSEQVAGTRPRAGERNATSAKDSNCVRVEWQTRNVASFGGPMQMVRVPVCIKDKRAGRS